MAASPTPQAPPAPLKVWLGGKSADVPFDSTKKISRVQLEALAALFPGDTPKPNPLDYQVGTLDPNPLFFAPGSSLGDLKVSPGTDLLLIARHKQGKSDIRWAIGMGFYTGFILLFALFFLASLWPWTTSDLTPSTTRLITIHFYWTFGPYAVGPEVLLLFIVFLSGIIGATVWGIFVLAQHFSASQDFDKAWVAWYLTRPFIGAALAVIVYAVLRSGLFSAGSSVSAVSVIGVSTLSFLVGLFAENALFMLHRVADQMFGNPPDSKVATPQETTQQKSP